MNNRNLLNENVWSKMIVINNQYISFKLQAVKNELSRYFRLGMLLNLLKNKV